MAAWRAGGVGQFLRIADSPGHCLAVTLRPVGGFCLRWRIRPGVAVPVFCYFEVYGHHACHPARMTRLAGLQRNHVHPVILSGTAAAAKRAPIWACQNTRPGRPGAQSWNKILKVYGSIILRQNDVEMILPKKSSCQSLLRRCAVSSTYFSGMVLSPMLTADTEFRRTIVCCFAEALICSFMAPRWGLVISHDYFPGRCPSLLHFAPLGLFVCAPLTKNRRWQRSRFAAVRRATFPKRSLGKSLVSQESNQCKRNEDFFQLTEKPNW